MWIDELLQGQERNELAMLCKLVKNEPVKFLFAYAVVCNVTLIKMI